MSLSLRPTRGGCWFFLFAVFTTILLMGDPAVRAANAVCDDHPVLFSEYSKNPARFEGDVFTTYAPALGVASVTNWLPALLYKYAAVPPLWPAILFVLLQNVLLLFALRDLVRSFGINGPAAWLAPWITYAAQPWRWNLAWFHSVMHSPYPGHLVVPLLVYSLSRLLREEIRLSALCLFVAAFIHPSQTIYCGFLCVLFLVLRFGIRDLPDLARKGLWYVPALVACFVPAMFVVGNEPNPLTRTELMESLAYNGHFVPWTHATFYGWSLPTFLGALVLCGLALKRMPDLKRNASIYFISAVVTMLTFAFAQVAAMKLGIPPVAQLITLRVSVLVALTLFPIAVAFLIREFLGSAPERRIAAAFILLYHTIFPLGFCLGPVVVLARSWKRNAGYAVLAAWFVLVYLIMRQGWDPLSQWFIPGRGPVNSRWFLALGIFTVPLVLADRKWLAPDLRLGWAVVLLISFLSYREGQTTYAGPLRDRYDAQVWANRETPEPAIFIVPDQDPWRTLSLRRTVNTMPFNFHVYTRSRKSKDLGDAFAAFYAREGATRFADLTFAGILRFQKEFGGDFLLREVNKPLPLAEVYRNPTIVIYRMPDRSR